MTHLLECSDCGRRTFYEKDRCLDCGGGQFEAIEAGTGELVSTTTVHVTPDGVREPNRLGLARFEGGANLIAQIDGDLAVGDTVAISSERQLRESEGGGCSGPQLVPAEE